MIYSQKPSQPTLALQSSAKKAALLLLICTYTMTHAQQVFRPTTVSGAASILIESNSMIISGGFSGIESISQTFSIDLSMAWDTSNPKYTELAAGGPKYSAITNALLPDNTTWVLIKNGTSYEYNIPQNAWSTRPANHFFPTDNVTLGAAVDPSTGNFFVPSGYEDGSMMQYNRNRNTTANVAMPETLDAEGFAVAWSNSLGSLVMHGPSPSKGFGVLLTYNPATAQWKTLSPSGEIPNARKYHCMAPAYGGTKMILFGGYAPRLEYSSIFILDIATLVWKQLPPADNADARMFHTCAVNGDLFLAWGGILERAIVEKPLLIFNLKTNTWQTKFTPISGGGTGVSSTVGSSTSAAGSSKGVQMGSILGGLVVMLAGMGFII